MGLHCQLVGLHAVEQTGKTSTATCRPFVEKLFSTKLVPGAKKIGDHNTRGFEPIIEQERRKKVKSLSRV